MRSVIRAADRRATRRVAELALAAISSVVLASLATPAAALTTDPWSVDGGLVFAGERATVPTAPTDVWSATHRRTLVTLGTSGAGPTNCVIDTNGEAVCTGWSARGQLGIGTRYETSGPAAVSTEGPLAGKQLTAVASGGEHSCALATNGRAYCWGRAKEGQIGSGTTRDGAYSPTPVAIDGALAGLTLVAVTAGDRHSCAIASNGRAYCWGRGREGQLGNGSTSDAARPVAVTASGALQGRTLVGIDAGTNHTCAVDSVGAAFCWGAGGLGQLGDGTAHRSTEPVRVLGSGKALPFAQISAGAEHTCAISNGVPHCWGEGASGRLGTGTTDDHASPAPTAGVAGARSITTGDAHTCAITANRELFCWGYNDAGQLATGDRLNRLSPTPILQGDFAGQLPDAVAATAQGTCALSTIGDYFCWGQRQFLAPFTDTYLTQPTRVPSDPTLLDGQTITDVTDDAVHRCVLTDAGRAYCWGYGQQGQLGIGVWSGAVRPTAVLTDGALAGKTLVDITAGEYHTCALDSAGKAYCWGFGSGGQIGDGAGQSRRVPRAVDATGVLAGKVLVDITAGDTHTCALDKDGKAYCWGSGFQGQLGVGKNTASLTPVAVSTAGALAGATLTSIDAGHQHTCALDSVGKAYCWGNNYNGQLGDGTSTASSIPVAVSTSGVLNGRSLTDISAGGQTTCALTASGEPFCWGMGWSGAMGNGTALEVNASPVAVDTSGALSGVTLNQISVATVSVCTVSDDGRVYCWGGNSLGQFGVGTRDEQLVPAAMRTTGVLQDARVTLLGTGTETWMVTEPR